MSLPERRALRTCEATTTANIASYLTPLSPPVSRSPLKLLGYEHGAGQPDLCARCKRLGYICPECRRVEQVHEEQEYHHVRVNDPDKFDRIRTVTFGKGIKARIGFGGDAVGSSDVQSILFPKDRFSPSQAKKWAKEHRFDILKTKAAK